MSKGNANNNKIKELLSDKSKFLFPNIILLQEVTSTNDYLLKQSQESKANAICITEHQTAGRGQRGKTWSSEPNDICFSLLWNTPLNLEQLSGLSILTGIAIAESIQELSLNQPIQLKWPNDLFIEGKKTGGILIESTKNDTDTAIIIGIGINNNTQAPDVDQPTTSLKNYTSSHISSRNIITSIINNLTKKLFQFNENKLENYINNWKEFDLNYDKTISIYTNQETHTGINLGVNKKGALILKNKNNELIEFFSGSIITENAKAST
jgi:BirA family transcriptional regulator, biotin operon repressor / biotin---[acetyl-CoA-carboxylase] ligase